MTYAELVQQIQATAENYETTFVASIPDFVRRAEVRVFHEARLPVYQFNNGTVALTAGNPVGSWPAGFMVADHVVVTSGGMTDTLDEKDNSYLPVAFPSAVGGKPRIWAMESEALIRVAPVPDTNYTLKVVYYGLPPSIVDAGTSWIGDNFPTLLFYACMVEAYIFMKGEQDIMAMYVSSYSAEAEKLRNHPNAQAWKPVNA